MTAIRKDEIQPIPAGTILGNDTSGAASPKALTVAEAIAMGIGGLTAVAHDGTMRGDGTSGNPLTVIGGGGNVRRAIVRQWMAI